MEQYQKPTAFCPTPVARQIHKVIDLVRMYPEIGMGAIVGAPGVGKTTALLRYAAEKPGVRYCVMSPAQASMSRMLARVYEALDGPTRVTAAADLHERLRKVIQDRSPEALLVDEAQHLDDRSLDELRCIHDETGLPIVFAGNEGLRSRVIATGAAAFAQFASRIGSRLEIDAASADDVRALAEHYGIVDDSAVSWLAKRCVGTSGLRTVARLMALAAASTKDGGSIGLPQLKLVVNALGERW